MIVGCSKACFSHHEPVSVMAHMSSHHPCADAGIGHYDAPCDVGAICRPPEGSEDLSCCSPLNLAGPRPRDPTPPPPPPTLQPLAPHFTELATGSYPSDSIGPESLDPAQLQPNQHRHQPGYQHHHHQQGHQHRQHHQQQAAVRAERPPLGADWQLPPCATIRLARSPAPSHPLPQSLPPASVSSPPPQQLVPHHHPIPPLPHHHPQSQQPAASLASWPFRCSICGRGFESKQALRAHTEEHSVGKLCICDICGIRLSKKSSLRRHRMTHMDTKEYPCDVCRRSFYQRHDMLRHKAQHSKVALPCTGCSRQFSARHHLAAHKCSGTALPGGGRRPAGGGELACRLCSQTCSTPAAWGFHMWRHTKDAKYLPDFTGGAAVLTAPPEPQTDAGTGPDTELQQQQAVEREPAPGLCQRTESGCCNDLTG